ncbi:MAG: hypothetical protein ACYC6C_08260 [Coriobacteriia bacterium]
MQAFVDRALDAIRYPTEDPQTTLVIVLGVAVLGMLIAVVFIALASPARRVTSKSDDADLSKDSESNAE